MADGYKKRNPTSSEVIWIALKYFGALSKHKVALISVIVVTTIFKNYIICVSDRAKNQIKAADTLDRLKFVFLTSTTYKTLWAGMNFLTDYIFEHQLIPYGGFIAVKILKNVLYSNSKIPFETQGSEFEYYMSEGGKSLAKISRLIIFSLLSKACHFGFDLYNVYSLDTSNGKVALKLFLVSLFCLSVLKIWNIRKIAKLNKTVFDYAYEKEKIINENLDNMAIIKSYRAEQHALVKFLRKSFKYEFFNVNFKFWKLTNDLIYNIFSCVARPGATILYILAASGQATGKSNNQPFSFMSTITDMLKTINLTIEIFNNLIDCIAMSYEVIEYLNMARESALQKMRVSEFKKSIEVKNLSYTARDKLIFSDVNFSINKGDKIALFGRNGSGKSSIFKLILGFDEFSGQILFDDIPLNKLFMMDYRSLITYVPQDTKLFDDTIFYNLSFGNNKSFVEIVNECVKMGIHNTIMTFPNGYNTKVGENGKLLNGGLRQKIFYTRALLCDSEIYMFDEPTNNLDVNHSSFLLEYVNDPRFADKTMFVICHDSEIVNQFPTVMQFENGKIEVVKNHL